MSVPGLSGHNIGALSHGFATVHRFDNHKVYTLGLQISERPLVVVVHHHPDCVVDHAVLLPAGYLAKVLEQDVIPLVNPE